MARLTLEPDICWIQARRVSSVSHQTRAVKSLWVRSRSIKCKQSWSCRTAYVRLRSYWASPHILLEAVMFGNIMQNKRKMANLKSQKFIDPSHKFETTNVPIVRPPIPGSIKRSQKFCKLFSYECRFIYYKMWQQMRFGNKTKIIKLSIFTFPTRMTYHSWM